MITIVPSDFTSETPVVTALSSVTLPVLSTVNVIADSTLSYPSGATVSSRVYVPNGSSIS